MDKTRRRLLYGAALLGVAGCGASNDQNFNPVGAQTVPPPSTAGRLYVANAEGGTLSGNLLTLVSAAPEVVYFQDRPSRQAGRQSTESFVAGWASLGFASDPPNAVLEIDGRSFAIVLTDPLYEASTGTLRFIVRSDQGAPALSSVPSSFARPALFIDAAGTRVGDFDSRMTILLQTSSLPSNGDFQVFITGGDVVFVLDEDPNSFNLQATNISQVDARDGFVALYSGSPDSQSVFLALQLGANDGVSAFSLSNGSQSGVVITAQVPIGAAAKVVSTSGTAFPFSGS